MKQHSKFIISLNIYINSLIINRSSEGIIRKSALYSLRVLCAKSNDTVTYLKIRNILPFYYNFLKDSDSEIQAVLITS